jgi:uncharacterized protein YecE (DUF72 family)
MSRAVQSYIGTSGWNYKHWRNSIYPEKLAQARWLGFIAERLDTVEVNTSFYRIPKAETISKWQESTPGGFLFAVKLWRGITHYKKLLNAGQYVASFLQVIEVLQPERRAPLLIQLPPNRRKDTGKLEAFLIELRNLSPSPWDFAFEFRNTDWLTPDVYGLLDRHRVAVCLHDMQGRGATDKPNDAPFVYVRRHGSGEGRYAGSYAPKQIEEDAAQVRKWVRQGMPVYVYYNNDIGGHAFRNALDLKALCAIL